MQLYLIFWIDLHVYTNSVCASVINDAFAPGGGKY
jgi:hypothetical protein